MAGEVPPLEIIVNLNTSGVSSGVDETTAKLKNLSSQAEATGSKFTGLKSVMIGTFAAQEIQKGIQDFTSFLKSSVSAAEEAQTSVASLATALNNAKQNTEANRQAVEASTTAMQNLGFTSNDTRQALTTMVTATGSLSESQRLLGVAADYARLKHENLAEAAATLSRGTVGAARAFREFGITLDTHLPKNQAIAKAFDELNQKIGNQAAAYAETYAGKMQIMSAKMDDLKEKVGALLLPVLTKLASWFTGSLTWLANHKAALEAVAIVFGSILLVVIGNVTAALYAQAVAWVAANLPAVAIIATIALIVAGFVMLWNKSKLFRDIVVDVMMVAVKAVGWLLGAIGDLVTGWMKLITGPMKLFLEGMSHLPLVGGAAKAALKDINGATQDVGNFFDSAKKKVDSFGDGLENLKNKKISIKMPNIAGELAKAGGTANDNPTDITGLVPNGDTSKGALAAAKAAAKQQAELKKAQTEMLALHDQYNKDLLDRQNKMDAATKTHQDAVDKATAAHDQRMLDLNTTFNDAKAAADQAQQDADEAALTKHLDNLANINQQYADKAAQIEQTAADNRQKIIDQSRDALTNAFASATKIDLGTLFTDSGSTATGLASSLKTQLDQILKLQKDAGQLAAQGYSQSFIQEVLAKGPEVGDQMAQAVLNATPETQSQIKSLYGQIQTTSQDGLNDLAKQMNDGTSFATQALADQYAQVGVTLQQDLAKNSADLQTALAKENDTYQAALDAAADAHLKAMTAANDALAKGASDAQATLTAALTSAQDAYDKSIKDISDSTNSKLDALQKKISDTTNLIYKLGGVDISGSTSPTVTGIVPNYVASSTTAGGSVTSGAASPTTTGSAPNYGTSVTVNAPITVDGSTAASDIQQSVISIAKYGLAFTGSGSSKALGY